MAASSKSAGTDQEGIGVRAWCARNLIMKMSECCFGRILGCVCLFLGLQSL
jgi:hypothetical protein